MISSGATKLLTLPNVAKAADDLSAIPRIRSMRPETV
jgi:hypothetical protein